MFFKRKILVGLFFLFFAFPFWVKADVIINEVAWMGTEEGATNEWIELYNTSDQDINLNNWKIFEKGGETLVFTLTKNIAPYGYYLIIRGTSTNPFFNISDDAGPFGGNGLSNSGEYLIIKDSQNETVFSLDASSKWPAGKSETRETMQWTGEKWITAPSTPKAQNTTEAISDGDDDDENNNNNGSNSGTNDSNLSAHSGQVEVSNYDPGDIEISAGRDRLTNVRTPIEFRAESKSSLSGTFEWSFGDGSSERGAKVSHKYNFPGQYNVVLNYSSGSEEAVSRTTVTVTEPNFELAIFQDEGYLSLKNLGNWEENINDWKLKNGSSTIITFAKDTIVSPGGELKIPLPKEIRAEFWSLCCPDDFVIAEVGAELIGQEQIALSASTTAKVAELRQKLAEAQNMLAQIKNQQMAGVAALAAVGSVKFTKETSNDEGKSESLGATEASSNSATSDIIIIGKKEGMVTKILKAFKKVF